MNLLYNLINSILSWSCVYFPICNLLINPLKKRYKYSLYVFITLIEFYLYQSLGIYVNLIIFCIILLSISILSKYPLIDLCFAILGYLFSVCINYLYVIVFRFFNISFDVLEENFYIISGIIFTVLFYILSKWVGNKIRPLVIEWQITRSNPLFSKKAQLFCLLELLSCFCIYQFNIIYGENLQYSSQVITYNALLFFAFFIITIVLLGFLVHTLKKEAELATKLKEFQALQEYTNKVEQLYIEIRTFKHDYLNILSTLELYINQKRYNELKNYFEQQILPHGKNLASKDLVLGKLSLLKIPEIKSLFYPKLLIAMNQQLDTVVDIKDPVTEIDVDYLDLIRILGVFMDNAIEAAMETSEKTLYVGLITVDNTTIIRICNSCNPVENINKIYEINVSSKPGSRGIGLYNANLLIHKHSNIIHKTSCENHIFTQELQIIGGD